MRSAISFEPLRYRLCWIRETEPGVQEFDLGLELTSEQLVPALAGLRPRHASALGRVLVTEAGLADAFESYGRYSLLPVGARLRLAPMFGAISCEAELAGAREILATLKAVARRIGSSPSPAGDIEVHLPVMDNASWHNRVQLLGNLQFGLHTGRLMPVECIGDHETLTAHQATVAACAATRTDAHTIAGGDRAIPGYVALAWRGMPGARDARLFAAQSAVSVSIQNTLRRWIRKNWVACVPDQSDVTLVWPLLAYGASSPCPGCRPDRFTYDLTSPEWVYELLRKAGPVFRTLMRDAVISVSRLKRFEAARRYHPNLAKEALTWVRQNRTQVQEFVEIERSIIHAFMRWAAAIRDTSSGSDLAATCRALASAVHGALRKLPCAPAIDEAGSLLLVEATHALHRHLGGNAAMRDLTKPVRGGKRKIRACGSVPAAA